MQAALFSMQPSRSRPFPFFTALLIARRSLAARADTHRDPTLNTDQRGENVSRIEESGPSVRSPRRLVRSARAVLT